MGRCHCVRGGDGTGKCRSCMVREVGYDSRGSRQNARLSLVLREAGGIGISCGRCKAWQHIWISVGSFGGFRGLPIIHNLWVLNRKRSTQMYTSLTLAVTWLGALVRILISKTVLSEDSIHCGWTEKQGDYFTPPLISGNFLIGKTPGRWLMCA